jgi:RimJ/RimL family protein N-acetyltransferase/acyl carrier protein
MEKDKLLKKLNFEPPIDINNHLLFLNLSQSKKYYQEFFAYSKVKKFFEFFEYSNFKKKSDFFLFLKKLIKTEKNNFENETFQKFWLLVDIKKNKLIGTAKLSNIDPVRKSVEWGYGINSRFWGNHYILSVQLALLNYVFRKLNLNRLYGNTHINNTRVISGIEKLGFIKEGVKSDYYFNKDKKKFFDAYSYSLLRKDFIKNNISKNNSTNNIINFMQINKIISKVLKKKLSIKKNINMNDIPEWDSINHFEIISDIEKRFNKKFTNEQILQSSSTGGIWKALNN